MFKSAKNSKQQGDVGLGSAIAYFTQIGWTVSIPLNDSQEYDLIIDDKESLKKVQVKTSNFITKHDTFEVTLKTCGGNQSFHTIKYFEPSKVDLLFILLGNGDRYCIPTDKIDNITSITLGKKYTKYKV